MTLVMRGRVLSVTYHIKGNKPIVFNNFESFLDERFASAMVNCRLHETTVELINLVLTKRAEKAERVIQTILHKI